jgi:hypothetical protein
VRTLTLIVCGLDTLVTLAVVVETFGRIAEPATHSLDLAAGYAVLILFVVTAAPALWLTWRRRAPKLALSLSLAFPGFFAVLFIAAVIAFA